MRLLYVLIAATCLLVGSAASVFLYDRYLERQRIAEAEQRKAAAVDAARRAAIKVRYDRTCRERRNAGYEYDEARHACCFYGFEPICYHFETPR
jgi:hypothetical protein